MSDYVFYWSVVWAQLPLLMSGTALTIQITVLSVLIGTLLAMPMSLVKRSNGSVAGHIVGAWVEVARNTPTLFQIYMAYFGLGRIGIQIDSYPALLFAISFNNAGYLTEIFRGGLNAVPPQQLAAARSLGMSATAAYAYVVFPQVFKVVFYPFANQVTWAMLNTSLGMAIGLRELTGAAQYAQSLSFRTFEFFIVTAAIYYVVFKMIEIGTRFLARRLFRG
ncbi:MAG: amino acid ABC transporter permease [Rhodospirillales bacterium]|nr:amino acid ABC transporter permease [Rhodospirillales bacterium]